MKRRCATEGSAGSELTNRQLRASGFRKYTGLWGNCDAIDPNSGGEPCTSYAPTRTWEVVFLKKNTAT